MNTTTGSVSMEPFPCMYCCYLKNEEFDVPGESDQKIINKWILEANILEPDRFTPLKTIKLKNNEPTNEDRRSDAEKKLKGNLSGRVLMVGHGTKIEYVSSIIQEGFSLAKARLGKHGTGVYHCDLFYKTSLYSSVTPEAKICEDCKGTHRICTFISAIPTRLLNKKDGLQSEYKLQVIRNDKSTQSDRITLDVDEFGRYWRLQNPLGPGVDKKELLYDKYFNEFVVMGEQFKPLYLIIVKDNYNSK